MTENSSNYIEPEQIEVPKVLLIPESQLPDGFSYPQEFLFLVETRIVFFHPWQLLFGDRTKLRFVGLRKRYPNRLLVPFARRFNSDDVACWEGVDNQKVVVVHDFASPGWEDRGEQYASFWEWYRAAVEEMIEFEFYDRPSSECDE